MVGDPEPGAFRAGALLTGKGVPITFGLAQEAAQTAAERADSPAFKDLGTLWVLLVPEGTFRDCRKRRLARSDRRGDHQWGGQRPGIWPKANPHSTSQPLG